MWPYFSNLLIAGNIGIIVFFTVAVAPTIFTALPPQWSAAYVRKFFPKYFMYLGVTTAVAAALSVVAGLDLLRQSALLASAVIFFFNCFWLTPVSIRRETIKKQKSLRPCTGSVSDSTWHS